MKKLKLALLLLVILGIGGGLFFRKNLEMMLVDWSLQKYSLSYFGTKVLYDSIQSQGKNTFCCTYPKLHLKTGDIKGSALVIKYHLGFKGIDLQVELEEGKIHVENQQFPISFYGNTLKNEMGVLEIHLQQLPLNNALFKKFSKECEFEEGITDGKISFCFSKNKPVDFSGSLELRDFAWVHHTSKLRILGQEAHLLLEKKEGRLGMFESENLTLLLPERNEKNDLLHFLYQDLKKISFHAKACLKRTAQGFLLEGELPLPYQQMLTFDMKFSPEGVEQIWFEAKNLCFKDHPIHLFEGKTFHLNSLVNLVGEFYKEKLEGEISFQNFRLENDHFLVQFPEIVMPLRSKHTFLKNGFVHCKEKNLKFQEIEGNLHLSSESLALNNYSTTVNEICMLGDLCIDIPKTTLLVRQKGMNGSFEKCCELLKQLGIANPLEKFPIKGNFSLTGSGIEAEVNLCSSTQDFKFSVEGALSEGEYSYLKEVECHLGFNHEGQFHLNQLRGKFFAEGPNQEEWIVAGEGIQCNSLSKEPVCFDFWIGNRQRDLVRFKGNLFSLQGDRISVSLDPKKTHLGSLYPEFSNLELTNDFWLDRCKISLKFDLEQHLSDLKRLTPIAHLLFPKLDFEKLNSLKTGSGILYASLDLEKGVWNHHIQGKQIQINDLAAEDFEFLGSIQNQTWNLQSLLWNEMRISTQVQFGDSYHLSSFQANYKDFHLVSGKGTYHPNTGILSLPIQSLESSVHTFVELLPFSPLQEQLQLKGDLKGKGYLTLDFFEKWIGKTSLEVSLRNGEINGFAIQDMEHLLCRWHSDEGFFIHNCKTALLQKDQNPIDIDIGELGFRPSTSALWANDFRFVLPQGQEALLAKLNLSSQWIERLKDIQSDKPIICSINFENTLNSYKWQLSFNDGNYTLLDKTYPLKEISLSLWNQHFTLQCQTFLFHRWLPLEIEGDSFDTGTLTFFDEEKNKTICHWNYQKDNQYFIQSIRGNFSGLYFDLEKGTQPSTLVGTLSGKGEEIFPLLIGEKIYRNSEIKLEGVFSYLDIDSPSFIGNLYGKNLEMFEIPVESISSDLCFQKNQIQLQNTLFSDAKGEIRIPKILFERNQENLWKFWVPSLSGTDLRTNLFSKKQITIRELELQDLQGVLDQPKTIQAKGLLVFSKQEKNPLFPLFPPEEKGNFNKQIPALTPCSGKIHFEIGDEKITLLKLKEVYSDRRLIKFYLPKDSSSFIDFKGNLHIELALQPYNVLFKIDDLFTLFIEGNIREPIYALQ